MDKYIFDLFRLFWHIKEKLLISGSVQKQVPSFDPDPDFWPDPDSINKDVSEALQTSTVAPYLLPQQSHGHQCTVQCTVVPTYVYSYPVCRIRPVRGHGPVLFDDGLPPPLRLLDDQLPPPSCKHPTPCSNSIGSYVIKTYKKTCHIFIEKVGF